MRILIQLLANIGVELSEMAIDFGYTSVDVVNVSLNLVDVSKKLYHYAHGSGQWDSTPTASSTKPVTSGGVKAQFDLANNEFADINNVLGAKNILPNGASTVTTNGITFTVNSNGSVKATGTASADAVLVLSSSFYVGNGKKVILSGCPSGSSTSKYYIQMTNANGTTGKGNDIGSGVTITADADNLGCRIIVKKNQALGSTGVTFYPMVRPANIRNSSYVPYAMTNNELTTRYNKSFITAAVAETIYGFTGSSIYGVLDSALYSITLQVSGGTIPVNGSINISGVSVAQQYFAYNYQCVTFTAKMRKGTGLTFSFDQPSTQGIVIVNKLLYP